MKSYQDEWQQSAHARKSEENADMHVMMSLIEEMSACLVWGIYSDREAWMVRNKEGLAFQEKLWSFSGQHAVLVDRFGQGNLLLALQEGMTSASGREAVQAIFTTAVRVAFGKDDQMKAKVYPVGSSRSRHECFPVDIIHSVTHSTSSDCSALRSVDELKLTSASFSDCDSSVSGHGQGDVYADVIVASGHEPNWPRFLFLVEIRSESNLMTEHTAQLVREMLGPVMHQSVVFGLLINRQEASLYMMQHEFDKRKLDVSVINYNFRNNCAFSAQEFKTMFIDIVSALDYGKSNIQEIYHGF